jgi:anaphase-promoting complex subunit 3
LLGLLRQIGKAYQALCDYECKEAIELFEKLPKKQLSTGWVSCQIAKCHFELTNYPKAEQMY